MGKAEIDIRKKAPNVFTNEKDVKMRDALDGEAIKNSLKRMGAYPDFGGHYIKPGGQSWFDDIPDGPFNPYAEDCGFHDYNVDYADDFLICGIEGEGENFTIRFCDFNEGFNESFSICKGPSCKNRR